MWHGFSSDGGSRLRFITPTTTTTLAGNAGYTSVELAAGMTLAIAPNVGLYGEIGKLLNTGGRPAEVKSPIQGSVGIKVRF